MTFTYILETERKDKGYEHILRDNDRIYSRTNNPKKINNGNPTTKFFVKCARFHKRALKERPDLNNTGTKFEFEE